MSNLDDGDGTIEYELYVMNADGTGVTQLTHDTDADALYPDWSPDGTRIVFVDSEVITTISPDGSEPVALWNGGTSPSWSPDGRRIVFETANAGLYVMNADGSDAVHVPNTGADDYAPAWRPNPQP